MSGILSVAVYRSPKGKFQILLIKRGIPPFLGAGLFQVVLSADLGELGEDEAILGHGLSGGLGSKYTVFQSVPVIVLSPCMGISFCDLSMQNSCIEAPRTTKFDHKTIIVDRTMVANLNTQRLFAVAGMCMRQSIPGNDSLGLSTD